MSREVLVGTDGEGKVWISLSESTVLVFLHPKQARAIARVLFKKAGIAQGEAVEQPNTAKS